MLGQIYALARHGVLYDGRQDVVASAKAGLRKGPCCASRGGDFFNFLAQW